MKYLFPLLLVIVFGFTSCRPGNTQIKVRISDSNYLHMKYPGWFAENEDLGKESIKPELKESLRAELEEVRNAAVKIISERIIAASDPVPGIAGRLYKTKLTSDHPEGGDEWVFTINRNVDRTLITKLLESNLPCGFWETYNLEEIWEQISRINAILKDPSMAGKTGMVPDTAETGRENPLFRFLIPMTTAEGKLVEGCVIGNSALKDTAMVNRIFSLPETSLIMPGDIRLMWSLKPYPGTKDYHSLIALKMSSIDGLPVLTEKCIVDATADLKRYPPSVNISMNSEGAAIWERITTGNIGRCIAFTARNSVYFYPRVVMAIKSGSTSITGDFTSEEAEEMAILLGSGNMEGLDIKVLDVR